MSYLTARSNAYDEYGSLSGKPMNTSVILYLLIQLLCLIIPLSSPSQPHAEPPPPPALYQSDGTTLTYDGKTYRIIKVSGGNTSGHRDPSVAVNIGFGTREYWALTNEHSQLIHVLAPRIIPQDPTTEPLTQRGRYYSDEARVAGTERPDLDQGHIIADSLGGVANAYNITPQNSHLNRHGPQARMEKRIRTAHGCTDFTATITYPNPKTQIPSAYHYTYKLRGVDTIIKEKFTNTNPEE